MGGSRHTQQKEETIGWERYEWLYRAVYLHIVQRVVMLQPRKLLSWLRTSLHNGLICKDKVGRKIVGLKLFYFCSVFPIHTALCCFSFQKLFNNRSFNTSVKYLISGPGVDESPEIGLFSIEDDENGHVYVHRTIDREKTPSFQVIYFKEYLKLFANINCFLMAKCITEMRQTNKNFKCVFSYLKPTKIIVSAEGTSTVLLIINCRDIFGFQVSVYFCSIIFLTWPWLYPTNEKFVLKFKVRYSCFLTPQTPNQDNGTKKLGITKGRSCKVLLQ